MESVVVPSCKALFLLLLVSSLQSTLTESASDPVILESPDNVTIALGHDPVTQTCRVEGDTIFMMVNGEVADHTNRAELQMRGISFSNQRHQNGITIENVTVTATPMNNNTIIQCIGTVSAVGVTPVFSDNAIILVAGPPLSPSLQYSGVNETVIQVFWDEPFTLDDFPITGYNVTVFSFNNQVNEVVASSVMSPDTLSFTLTQSDSYACTNLTLSVSAVNGVGESPPGIITGAFLSSPEEFVERPSAEVTFSKDLTPILHINFTFPYLCPYNNATYQISITEDSSGKLTDRTEPVSYPWQEGGDEVIMVMDDNHLRLNSEYSGVIDVSTDVGQSSTVFKFDTYQEGTGPTLESPYPDRVRPPKGDLDFIYYTVPVCIIGTVLLMLMIASFIICGIYTYRRNVKRKRDCAHTTELATHVSRGMPMVVNPIYEGGAIYEEIPGDNGYKPHSEPTPTEREEGYVSISSSATINRSNGAIEKFNAERGREEVYTKMDSVGTLMGHLNSGASAMGSPEQPTEAAFYSNISCNGGGGASANCQVPEQDGRYVIVHLN